jgi:tetratricopeptide (TPR) repeat protein
MAAETSPSEFARAFREVVTDASRRLHLLKKELAVACKMRTDRFSHLQSGLRRPTTQEIENIVRGLRLDPAAEAMLRRAAGSRRPEDVAQAAQLAGNVDASERDLAQLGIANDITAVRDAWALFVDVQARNLKHEWADVHRQHEEGMRRYWELRAMAARYLAQVDLAAATARERLNLIGPARVAAEEGLQAANAAASQPHQVLLLIRLASIEQVRSNYDEAARRYDHALVIFDEWLGADSNAGLRRAVSRDWHAHWKARLHRMRGWLELSMGQPDHALRWLDLSLQHFRQTGHGYELSQVSYGRAWAYALRGDVELAASLNRQGLGYVSDDGAARGRADELALLQGHLYLGGNYLYTDDLPSARHHLGEAVIRAGSPRLTECHEVGRVHLLMGKLEARAEAWSAAHGHMKRALEFYSRREEQVLLSTAHRAMGDLLVAGGEGPGAQGALHHYESALRAARSSRPVNRYHECAALVSLYRTRVQAGLPSPEHARTEDGLADIDALGAEAAAIGQEHGYRKHLARLAAAEAARAMARGDQMAAERAAGRALHLANNFNPQLLREIQAELAGLGRLPRDLLDASIPPRPPG